MLDVALDVGDAAAGVALVPATVELLSCGPKLHDQIAGEVLPLDLAAFLLPEAAKGGFEFSVCGGMLRQRMAQ